MIGNETIKEARSDLLYNLAGIYLILVGFIGGTLNIFALLKAITVREIIKQNSYKLMINFAGVAQTFIEHFM